MYRFFSTTGRQARCRRWGSAAVIVACVGLSGGCAKCNLLGDNFSDDTLAAQCRQMRTADHSNELFGLSNKAQQIEKDVGVK